MRFLEYWGKRSKIDGADSEHLLAYHCLDVAAVGKVLLSDSRLLNDISSLLKVSPEQLLDLMAFFFALHDLGKFSSAFQALSPMSTRSSLCPYDPSSARHDRLGAYFWHHIHSDVMRMFGIENGGEQELLKVFMNVVLGHHGHPVELNKTYQLKKFIGQSDLPDVREFVQELYRLMQPEFYLTMDRQSLEQVSWYFAGVTVLADWIGSDRTYFQYCSTPMPLSDYWEIAKERAVTAVEQSGIGLRPTSSSFISVEHHFGFKPTPLQKWAQDVPIHNGPQLFVLEDITGAGKTEAALTLTHRLMEQGDADGFYFGLPTMATSNAMFYRVADHYRQLFSANSSSPIPSIVLAQSSSALNARFQEIKLASSPLDNNCSPKGESATAQCHAWFADSRKKALLAPVGVGTIDQALLAVLPRNHQSLRQLGLYRKVLILDEIHAADEYMLTLLESLLALHLRHGGSAILLTATLSSEQRQKLVNTWLQAGQNTPQPLRCTGVHDFPLATHVSINAQYPLVEQRLESRQDVCREVCVTELHNEADCIECIITAVKEGHCVAWIRNSVDDARKAYLQIEEALKYEGLVLPNQLMLFHSQFTLQDRQKVEAQVLATFGKKSNDGTVISSAMRQGKVLIATQVFQESLDADVDVMISDICPIDDLIQRTGRLHRHTRDVDGRYYDGVDRRLPPVLYLHAPIWEANPNRDWLSRDFINTEYVYRSPGRLWLAQRKLQELGAIRMPNEARLLIESVYSANSQAQIPSALMAKELELIGEERAKKSSASSQAIDFRHGYCCDSQKHWFEDQSAISTRYIEQETVQVLVLKPVEGNALTPWSDNSEQAIALSVISLSKLKYADHLQTLTEQQITELEAQYPHVKYLQPWCSEWDPKFGYSAESGFYQRQQENENESPL